MLDAEFFVSEKELTLRFTHGEGLRRLSFANAKRSPQEWRQASRQKLSDLLGVELEVSAGKVKELRRTLIDNVSIIALTMEVNEGLSIPAYLLMPSSPITTEKAVIAIHGHGSVEPCIGAWDDYHHAFALELARNGHIVLCPELRGFGVLKDVALHSEGMRLDYWSWGGHMAYSLVSDGFIHGKPLIGETVADLLRWDDWLASDQGIKTIDVAGISYGGDLALMYPIFSERVDRIFASGTLGSLSVIFSQCYNAPAHGIPGILQWMDRSDIAGLNVPRPLLIHYGALDTPSPENFSASYNQTVPVSLQELRDIYSAFDAADKISVVVSKGKVHEIDNEALLQFLKHP